MRRLARIATLHLGAGVEDARRSQPSLEIVPRSKPMFVAPPLPKKKKDQTCYIHSLPLFFFLFTQPHGNQRDSCVASQLSLEGEKSPSLVANGPELPLKQVKEAINGQGNKISAEGLVDEKSEKNISSSDLSAVEDYRDLPDGQEKSGTGPQSPLLEEKVKPAENRVLDHLKEDSEPARKGDPDGGSQPENNPLEMPTEEKLANGSLNLSSQFENDSSSKRDSDSGSTSASDSVDLSISLSADLSLNRGSGSLSLKVRIWGPILECVMEIKASGVLLK